MSDDNTYNTDGDIDTSNNDIDSGSFDDAETVSKEDYEKMAKKANDQERARIKREAELKELKAKYESSGDKESSDSQEVEEKATVATGLSREDRLELKIDGFKEQAEIEIIEKAVAAGMTLDDAKSNSFVLGQIETMRNAKQVEQATDFSATGGSSSVSKEDAIVRQFKKTGQIPDEPGAIKAIREAAKSDSDVATKLVLG